MTQGRHTHPWMNTAIRRKINQKQKAHKKARKTKKKRDPDRYKRLRQEVQDWKDANVVPLFKKDERHLRM